MNFSDYKESVCNKWLHRIFMLCWTITPAVFAVEIFVFIVFCVKVFHFPATLGRYILLRIVIPSALNLAASIACTVIFPREDVSVRKKSWVGTFALWVFCSSIAIFHNYFSPLLFLPCLPIFVSTVFSERKLTFSVAAAGLVSSIMAFITWGMDNVASMGLTMVIINVIVSLAPLGFSFFIANLLMKSQMEQVDFIYNAYITQEELINELHIEPMTGLCNRIALNEVVELYIRKFHEGEFVPHLALIDIDRFKQVNDTYGHNAGDSVIKTLAGILKNRMGGISRAFRFGGDEMVLLFGPESEDEIREIIENIRSDFKNADFRFPHKEAFTLSIGISAFYRGLTPRTWFELTDSAMYSSKQGGRDKVSFSGAS
ncbi:MAG TPA: hypothetical protein DCM57_03540 [Treponema sp.]|nr:hypothetical protein [Treponema sp.]HBB43583.1 hypothetical protein [Treponema sp.]